ncbi:MAG TPA: CHASE domain-containing protein, partial [Janthinobacterium sp.]|nr:CHASE domain-containing protein [Janthinobacterium sp.]
MDKNAFLPPAARTIPDWAGPRLLAGLVLLVCLVLTAGLWHNAEQNAQQRMQAAFDSRVHVLVNAIAARMQTYIQVLHGVQGLYASSESVEREEFRRYFTSQQLQTNVPGVRGLGYMELVPRARLEAHVAQLRRAGFADYAVRPAGERAWYAPIVYLEPFTGGNLRAFGYDPYSEAVRRAALEQARDSGQAAMSGKIRLVQDDENVVQFGFLIVLPVYDNGLPHDTLAQRRAAIRGWVYAPFRTGDFMAGLGSEQAARMDVEIYDGDRVSEEARMFDSAAGLAQRLPMGSEQKISIAGRRWTVLIGAHPGQTLVQRPLLIACCGLAISLGLALLTWLLARSRRRGLAALHQAGLLAARLKEGQADMQAMAETAQRSQAMLRSILDSTIDGILVDGADDRILSLNRCFSELWQLPATLDWQSDSGALFAHVDSLLEQAAPPRQAHEQASFTPGTGQREERSVLYLKDGRVIEQVIRGLQLGNHPARLWSFRDITERSHTEQRERTRRQVLELLATGVALPAVLEAVVRGVEAGNPAMICSILLLEEKSRCLRLGAAPGLPDFYNAAIDGLRVNDGPDGPGQGSCGSAVARGRRVIVEDIRSDPLWAAFRDLAASARLASCWSEPILGSAGKVLGTFAIYHRRPHRPSPAN